MSAPDIDVPAFPVTLPNGYVCDGLTTREYFAAKAMQGLLGNAFLMQDATRMEEKTSVLIMGMAVKAADALIKALEKEA